MISSVSFFLPLTDCSFVSADSSITPLESALMALEDLIKNCSVSLEDLDDARSSIKDMVRSLLLQIVLII